MQLQVIDVISKYNNTSLSMSIKLLYCMYDLYCIHACTTHIHEVVRYLLGQVYLNKIYILHIANSYWWRRSSEA